jgi:hypothetical protein
MPATVPILTRSTRPNRIPTANGSFSVHCIPSGPSTRKSLPSKQTPFVFELNSRMVTIFAFVYKNRKDGACVRLYFDMNALNSGETVRKETLVVLRVVRVTSSRPEPGFFLASSRMACTEISNPFFLLLFTISKRASTSRLTQLGQRRRSVCMQYRLTRFGHGLDRLSTKPFIKAISLREGNHNQCGHTLGINWASIGYHMGINWAPNTQFKAYTVLCLYRSIKKHQKLRTWFQRLIYCGK